MWPRIRTLIFKMHLPKGARAVFLWSCALFLVVRFAASCSSVDVIRNMDPAEYQVAHRAHDILGKTEGDNLTNRLGMMNATAAMLVPAVILHIPETLALKTLAILISFLGFAALLVLLIWRVGLFPAAFFAIFMSFPGPDELAWSLSLAGPYGQACTLVALGLATWAIAEGLGARRGYFAAGLMLGLVGSFSIYFVYAALSVMAVAMPLASEMPVRRKLLPLVTGFLAGSITLVLMMLSHDATNLIGAWATAGPHPVSPAGAWTVPTLANFRKLAADSAGWGFFPGVLRRGFLAAGLIWITLRAIMRRQYWLLCLPASFLLAAVFFSAFAFPAHLDARHFLWLSAAGYFCVAILAGDFARAVARKPLFTDFRWVRYSLPSLLVIILIGGQVLQTTPFIRPSRMGTIFRFRGMEYYRDNIGQIFGDEVRNVNCFLDRAPGRMSDKEFRLAFGRIFPSSPLSGCCLRQAETVRLKELIRPNDAGAVKEYFRGAGCACALKSGMSRGDLEQIGGFFGQDAFAAAEEGYDECVNFPCIRKPAGP